MKVGSMKLSIKTMMIMFIAAPLAMTSQTASAITAAELHAMQKHCAGLGRNVGINPSGELKCGSARTVSGPSIENGAKPSLKAKPSQELKLAPEVKK